MATIMKQVYDCATGEESLVPMTAEEIAAWETSKAQQEEEALARKQAEEARLAAKESAQKKLKTLGLSDAEIAAIIGA